MVEISGPVTITEPGTYVLINDIVASGHGIVVTCNDVVIDLAGHRITGLNGTDSLAAGVLALDCQNVTVGNGQISGFAYGVYLSDTSETYSLVSNGLVHDLSIAECTFRGVRVEGSGNVVRDNSITAIGGATFAANAYAMGIETYGVDGLIERNLIHDVRGGGSADLGEGVGICLSQGAGGTQVFSNTLTQTAREVSADYYDWIAESRSSYGVFIGGTPEGVAVSDNTIDKFFYGVTYSRAAAGIYSGNHVTDAFVPYYLVNNDGTRVLDGGGNLSDADSQPLIYGRVQPGAVETLEADYLSPLHRGSDFLFIPIRNPTAGDDLIQGTDGLDMVDYWLSQYVPSGPVSVDLAAGTATGWGGTDQLVGIEGVQGTIHDDTLRGDAGSNLIAGSAGNDLIEGRGGADYLFGDDGDDWIVPGAGARLVDGGSGIDTVSYSDQAYDSFTISLVVPALNSGPAAGTVFRNIEHFILGSGNDYFYGSAGNETIDGGGGSDMIFAGGGADIIDGGDGFDYVRFDDAGYDGLVVDLSNNVRGTGAAAGDHYMNVEGLVLTQNDDRAYGTAGNDYIYGMGGNDMLFGSLGADYLDGGAGFDYARFDDAGYSGLVADLSNHVAGTGAAAGDIFVNIEGLVLTQNNDIAYGTAGSNYIYGLGGNDMLYGSLGADYLDGGSGFDYARFDEAGYAGLVADLSNQVAGTGAAAGDTYVNIEGLVLTCNNDIGYGNAGDNYLYGMAGDDILNGRQGVDHLYGGAGADCFMFDEQPGAQNADFIHDFESGVDRIGLSSLLFDSLQIDGGGLRLVSGSSPEASSTAATLLFNTDSGTLSYDADGTGSQPAQAVFTLLGTGPFTLSESDLFLF